MLTHDCSNCETAGDCPIESSAPWLNEHEEGGVKPEVFVVPNDEEYPDLG